MLFSEILKKHTNNRNKKNISIVYTIVSNILTLFRNTY